jgi:DNA-binding response OmpR family regulator
VKDTPYLVSDGTAAARRARVLIVEDEAMVATYIADVLQESGFAVAGMASTGAEALSIARDDTIDVALVDIKLAGAMDGIEFASTIRRDHGIGTIFLSGATDPRIFERARVAAPLGFLHKPFLPSQVYNTLDRALRERRHPARRA